MAFVGKADVAQKSANGHALELLLGSAEYATSTETILLRLILRREYRLLGTKPAGVPARYW